MSSNPSLSQHPRSSLAAEVGIRKHSKAKGGKSGRKKKGRPGSTHHKSGRSPLDVRLHPVLSKLLSTSDFVDEKGVKVVEKLSEKEGSLARSLLVSTSSRSVYPMLLGYTTNITSTVGAIINAVIPDSSAFSSNNFSSLANVFDEYRVREIHVIIESFNKYSKTTTSSGPVFMAHDDVDQTAITSAAQIADYGNCFISNTDDWFPDRHGTGIKFVKSAEESVNLWQPTSATTITGGIKFWSTAVTASITYATVLIRYLVEFRLLV